VRARSKIDLFFGPTTIKLDVAGLAPGLYLLQAEADSFTPLRVIVK
jgi:hypothetical protein